MQTLCKSDYQDVYRVKDGVLLVVNKFAYIQNKEGYRRRVDATGKNAMNYAVGCKDLKKVTKRIKDIDGNCVEVGQVLYHGYPVSLAPKSSWDYQIKTTGDMFSGNKNEITKYIEEINKIIKLN